MDVNLLVHFRYKRPVTSRRHLFHTVTTVPGAPLTIFWSLGTRNMLENALRTNDLFYYFYFRLIFVHKFWWDRRGHITIEYHSKNIYKNL